jgi:transposase
MNTTTIGLDIAKRIFQAHGTDSRGKTSVTRRLKRAEVLRFCALIAPKYWTPQRQYRQEFSVLS